MTSQALEALHAQLGALEAELDASEGKVERALTAAMVFALIGTLGIVLGIGISVYLVIG